MPESRSDTVSQSRRQDNILSILQADFAQLFGIGPAELDTGKTFLELGADSLFLLQVSQSINNRFGITIPFRRLLEQYTTINALAEYIDQELPPGEFIPTAPAHAPVADATPRDSQRQLSDVIPSETLVSLSTRAIEEPAVPSNGLENILLRQLDILARQITLMECSLTTPGARPSSREAQASTPQTRAQAIYVSSDAPDDAPELERNMNAHSHSPSAAIEYDARASVLQSEPEPFVAYQPIEIEAAGRLTARQQRHLDSLIERVSQRTRGSKGMTQAYRGVLADSRSSAGFRLAWKEMMYPIVVQRAAGSRVWDVDGNEYVDLTNGFGSLLFGHSPSFLTRALEGQIEQGMQLGLESNLAGKVAELLCEMTGMERAAFFNSGTEAVMTALRLARAVTGRGKIALFAGAYHGTFDGVLVRGQKVAKDRLHPVPMAPGVPPEMVQNVLLLEYCNPQSLEILKGKLHELAAVLVEPMPSRRPDVQPEWFLRELRQLTNETETPLIFDEVVTGFRMHPGGVQALLGIRADIAIYGKAIGAGMPIGVVAGKAEYLDAIDGGMWEYGDASYPQALQTYVAGTFFQHPLSMSAAWAVLNHIKESGPELHQRLNQRTTFLVEGLNNVFEQEQMPIQAVHFGSLFRFKYPPSLELMDLLFYHLLEKGVYVWEGRVCNLSMAHGDEDVNHVIRAFKESLIEMRQGGILPEGDPLRGGNDRFAYSAGHSTAASYSSSGSDAVLATGGGPYEEATSAKTVPLTEAQRGIWILAQMGEESSRAYNESVTLRLRGPMNPRAMRSAIEQTVNRHEALRATFDPDGNYQQFSPSMKIEVPVIDFSHLDDGLRKAEVAEWLEKEARQTFDFVTNPPVRTRIAKLDEQDHLLVFIIHHIIIDAWSFGVLLSDLSSLYSAECRGVTCHLPEPMQFSQYVLWQARQNESQDIAADEVYWLKQFGGAVPVLDLPSDYEQPSLQTYSGGSQAMTIDSVLCEDVKRLSTSQSCTLYMTLLAGFYILLNYLTDNSDIIIGSHSAGQSAVGGKDLVGFCINMLPLRCQIVEESTITNILASVRGTVLDARDHHTYPLARLIKKLGLRRDSGRPPLVTVVFNMDPATPRPRFWGLEADVAPRAPVFSRFDVLWNTYEKDGEIVLQSEFNTDLFDAETLHTWLRQFRSILSAMVARPNARLSELKRDLAAADESNRIITEKDLEEANRQKLDRVRRKTIHLTTSI